MTQRGWVVLACATVLTLAGDVAAQLGRTNAPVSQNTTRETTAVVIQLSGEQSPSMLCHYPISGNYCALPRVLFYATTIASLLLRHHPWLYVGALAASLTYSGSGAIHACLALWADRAWGELDIIALVAILSVSCIVLVPLLNWSSTIRNAGREAKQARRQKGKTERVVARLQEWNRRETDLLTSKRLTESNAQRIAKLNLAEKRHDEKFQRRLKHLQMRQYKKRPDDLDAVSRTVLIVWGCLVMVSFIVVFAAVVDQTPEARFGHFQQWTWSYAKEITCVPSNGLLDYSEGQDPMWPMLIYSAEFLDANNCQDPCPIAPAHQGSALFRQPADRAAFNKNNLNMVFYGRAEQDSQAKWSFILAYTYNLSWITIYVVLQGIWAVFLGRSEPQEARLRLYGSFIRWRFGRRPRHGGRRGSLQHRLAKLVAFMLYLWAVFVTILAIPLLVVNVTVVEMFLYELPQSESPIHIGAWSPWVSTGLALIAALMANSRLKSRIKTLFTVSMKNLGSIRCLVVKVPQKSQNQLDLKIYVRALQVMRDVTYTMPIDFIVEQRNDIIDALREEWKGTVAFWESPDIQLKEYQERMAVDRQADQENGDERGVSHSRDDQDVAYDTCNQDDEPQTALLEMPVQESRVIA